MAGSFSEALVNLKKEQNAQMNQELAGIQNLYRYHPLVIEGMGGYDTRDPSWVTGNIIHQLNARWAVDPPKKPLVLHPRGPLRGNSNSGDNKACRGSACHPEGMIFSIQTSRITTLPMRIATK